MTPSKHAPSDIYSWVDEQTKNNKPALLMVYDPDAQYGHVYLANGPAFGMAVVASLDVPRPLAGIVGEHLDYLFREHRDGRPVIAGQTSATPPDDTGGRFVFSLTAPPKRLRNRLMKNELAQTHFRWPAADVLLLLPHDVIDSVANPPAKATIH